MRAFIPTLCAALLLAASGSTDVRWSVPIDSRTTSQWLAESSGAVYGLQSGHPAAFDVRTGQRLWTNDAVTALGAPAFADGLVAFPVHDGIAWFDARSGRELHRTPLDAIPQLLGSSSGVIAVLGEMRHGDNVIAVNPNGTRRWARRVAFYVADAIALRRNALALFNVGMQSGVLIVDATSGRDVAFATHVNELVGDDGRFLWFTVDRGGIKGLDLETNRTVVMHGDVIPKAVTVEHATAVAVIDGRLVRIDLNGSSKPIPLHIDGRWIGGPIDGKLFIERGDGLYLQPLEGTARPIRIAAYEAESRVVASDRSVGYVGLRDGRLFVVDVARGALVSVYRTGCGFYEGFTASGDMAIVHCDDANASRLIGIPRAN